MNNNTQQPSPEVAAQFDAAVEAVRVQEHIDARRDAHAQALLEAMDFYTCHGVTAGDLVALNGLWGAVARMVSKRGAK